VKFRHPEPEYSIGRDKEMRKSTKIYIDFEGTNLKEIRQRLKKEFNHKFLVSRGKGRSSNGIHIIWDDGPSIGQILDFYNS